MQMTQEQKLDEALKGTFPASDAFYIQPDEDNSAAAVSEVACSPSADRYS